MADVHTFVCFLFTWQVLHDFVMDWMVFLIPFQYIAAFIVSLRFETGMPGVLEIVVIQHDCMPLQGLQYYEPTFIAYATFVFNNLKF
jgi:hypothetical protein